MLDLEGDDLLAAIDAQLLQLTVLRRAVSRAMPQTDSAGQLPHIHLPQEIDGMLYCSDAKCGELIGSASAATDGVGASDGTP